MNKIIIDYIWYYKNQILSKTNIIKVDLRKYSGLDSYVGDLPRILKEKDLEKFTKSFFYDNNEKLILNPVKIYKNPFNENSYILLCEVYKDDDIPHKLNKRKELSDNKSCKKINIKQKITFNKSDTHYSPYRINAINKNIINSFLKICVDLNIKLFEIYSYNKNSWIFEINSLSIITNIDDLIISIYILTILSDSTVIFDDVILNVDKEKDIVIKNDDYYDIIKFL